MFRLCLYFLRLYTKLEFPIGEMYSVQSPSMNIWILRFIITTDLNGCFSTAMLYRTSLCKLHINWPQVLSLESNLTHWGHERMVSPFKNHTAIRNSMKKRTRTGEGWTVKYWLGIPDVQP